MRAKFGLALDLMMIVVMLIGVSSNFWIRVTNPDMTEMRILIDHGLWILPSHILPAAVLAWRYGN
jgi:hypothetical protein